MRHRTLLIALLLIVTVTLVGRASIVRAQQDARLEDPPWIKEVATQRLVYAIPGMEKIKARKDLTYKRVAGDELKMDVFSPRNLRRGARRPAILFIHGGALPPNLLTKPKQWGVYVSYGQLAAASGFVGITFNHRFYGWDMKALSDARGDVADAIAYVRSNAERLGIDKDRICLWALSAGSVVVGPVISDAPSFIRCMVFYYSIMDLEPLRKERPVITGDVTREFSPIYRLKAARTLAPLFIARAGRDEPGLNVAVDSFIQEALLKRATLDFSNHAEGQHGFDVLDDNERSREIIKRTVEFISARVYAQGSLGPKPKKPRTLDDYAPRTLKELVAKGDDERSRGNKEETMIVHGDILPSRVRVTYTGSSRPLPEIKKEVLRQWARLYAGSLEHYNRRYETEMLFLENGTEHWLAVRKESLPHFAQELKKGEAVDLYLTRVGAAKASDTAPNSWETMLLIENFRKPN